MDNPILRKALPWLVGLVCVGIAGILPGPFLKPIPMVVAFLLGAFVTKVVLTPRHDPATVFISDGITKLEMDNTLREARASLNALQNEAFRITKPESKARVTEIGRLVEEIIKDIKAHPEDFRTARQFFNYYLGATLKVVKAYSELSVRPEKTPELEASLRNVEDELATIEAAFSKQLKVLVENDVMDLDIELKVLKTTIAMEGLGTPPGTSGTTTSSPGKDSGSGPTSGPAAGGGNASNTSSGSGLKPL